MMDNQKREIRGGEVMIITLAQLENKGACKEALRAFKRAVGERTGDIDWTSAAQGWVLGDPLWRRWLGWGWYEEIVPQWSMENADFKGADLSGADLLGADLREANLSEANLYGADLRWADLFRADLREANLSEANLRGADLRGANLCRADLSGANLSRADLNRANLLGAIGVIVNQ
jgi:uncharacterized protein YjbI with pentapeptide repeats